MEFENPPPRSPLPLGLIIALSGFGLLVTIVFAVMMIRGFGHRSSDSIVTGSIRLDRGPSPMRQAETIAVSPLAQSGETALNESNADQVVASGNQTTFIKTFALDDGAAFSLKNISGSIAVSGWDQPKAEVRVIQSGSDHGGHVFFTGNPRGVYIRTAQTSRNQEVRFEVRLPYELSRIDLNSVNGSINLSHVSAAITIQSVNGAIDLVDVSGVSKIQTANGEITALLEGTSARTMEFVNVNGGIQLTMKSAFDANLEASSVHGNISIGDQYGIAVQKEVVGQCARGLIGSGGPLLKLTTVNGNIKLTNGNTQQAESGGQVLKLTTVNGSIKLTNGNARTTIQGKIKLAK